MKKYDEKNEEIYLLKNKIKSFFTNETKTIETDQVFNKETTNSEFIEIHNEHNEIIKSILIFQA